MPSLVEQYISKIKPDFKGGIATEHTYRSTLEWLLENFEKGVKASNDPRHIECGAPDFVVERRKVPVGYVETKDIGADLNRVEKTDQLKRYRKALNNLILTDYLEFRWYLKGELRLKVRIADTVGTGLRPDPAGIAQLESLLREFYQAEVPTITTPKELATRLAEQTHLVRDLIFNALQSEDKSVSSALARQLDTFRQFLIPNLSEAEFADLYAQTMAYGLFAAKLSAPANAPFSRAAAYQYLTANRFLRRLFLDVGEELDGTLIAPFLDDIAALLERADFASILSEFGRRTRTEDPVVHFYETFLAHYDPKLRESRGVYYTPEPVVSFIVRSVDWLLKDKFGRTRGLADENVKILDPATGTGTFLYYVIKQVHDSQHESGQAGLWPATAKKLLTRIFGFELLMAPYVVSHLKLGLQMRELGVPLEPNQRLGIYLTNTLEEAFTKSEMLESLSFYIAEEASHAALVKKQEPIMVVLGNPPYSNYGMLNKSEWILGLLDGYKQGLREKKINLDDDYIKFIRFGQWRIDRTGQGILAFVTNNSFIDGVTHRRMRKSLMDSFSEIYIVDLHGNSRKQEITPDGLPDKNVFDIQQGVSISILVKTPGQNGPARVHHVDIFGSREQKYQWLNANDISVPGIEELHNVERSSCLETFYFFTPKAFDNIDEYCKYWSMKDAFTINQNGVKTDRDELFFDQDRNALERRMKVFYSPEGIREPFKSMFNVKNSSSYDLLGKREKSRFDKTNFYECVYRPYDKLWVYYAPDITSRPAWDVMRHMIAGDNLGIITTRQATEDWDIFITKTMCGHKSCASYDINTLFPLYLYTTPEETAGTLFAQTETTRRPNLNPRFIEEFSTKLGLQFDPSSSPKFDAPQSNLGEVAAGRRGSFGPEDVFYYAYAVFHSPSYRQRYAEFLKIDFPRLPLTGDVKFFARLVALGKELVDYHLLRTPKVENFITTFPIAGDNTVEKPQYAKGKVWINPTQYFGNLPEEVWNFKVGGYQVCDKWLKDRKGRTLSSDDILHYQRVVVALQETLRLMQEVDESIPEWPIG